MYSPIFSKTFPIIKAWTFYLLYFERIISEEMGSDNKGERGRGSQSTSSQDSLWLQHDVVIWVSQVAFSQNCPVTKQQIVSPFQHDWNADFRPQDTSSDGINHCETMRTPEHMCLYLLSAYHLRLACESSSALLRVLKLERFPIQWDFLFSCLSSPALSPWLSQIKAGFFFFFGGCWVSSLN